MQNNVRNKEKQDDLVEIKIESESEVNEKIKGNLSEKISVLSSEKTLTMAKINLSQSFEEKKSQEKQV